MSKDERHEVVRRLLARNEIHTQDQLEALLDAEGIMTAQATLSRDLREIGAIKGPDGYSVALPGAELNELTRTLDPILGLGVRSAMRSGAMVVLQTTAGSAQRIARSFDAARLGNIIGTIAGEDTVFLATPSSGQARTLAWQLVRLLRRRT